MTDQKSRLTERDLSTAQTVEDVLRADLKQRVLAQAHS